MMSATRGTIVYIGGFELPDKNAAAHRVLGVAKSLREIGYHVVLLGKGDGSNGSGMENLPYCVEGFDAYTVLKKGKGAALEEMIYTEHVSRAIEKYPDVAAVILYNYPSLATEKILRMCRKKGIRVIADCTEWYDTKGVRALMKPMKWLDTVWRMTSVNKRLDGVIVISRYLESYYQGFVKTVRIPPTVDIRDSKWDITAQKKHDKTTLVYAGSPSATKEQLDIVIEAVLSISKNLDVELRVIGITEKEYEKMYGKQVKSCSAVTFCARMTHLQSLLEVKAADFSFIIRRSSRVTMAGFPTKFVEAVSCGTNVIATDCSDIKEYLMDGKQNGYLVGLDNLPCDLERILTSKSLPTVKREMFDYRNYCDALNSFLESAGHHE